LKSVVLPSFDSHDADERAKDEPYGVEPDVPLPLAQRGERAVLDAIDRTVVLAEDRPPLGVREVKRT